MEPAQTPSQPESRGHRGFTTLTSTQRPTSRPGNRPNCDAQPQSGIRGKTPDNKNGPEWSIMSDFSAQAPDHQPPWTRRRQTTGSDSSPTGEPWPLRFYHPGLSPEASIPARKQAKSGLTAPIRFKRTPDNKNGPEWPILSDFSAQDPDHQPPRTRRRQTTGSDSSPTGEPWPLRFYRPGLSPKACITARKQAKLRRTTPIRYQKKRLPTTKMGRNGPF